MTRLTTPSEITSFERRARKKRSCRMFSAIDVPVERCFEVVGKVAAAVEAAIKVLSKAVLKVAMGTVLDERFGSLTG